MLKTRMDRPPGVLFLDEAQLNKRFWSLCSCYSVLCICLKGAMHPHFATLAHTLSSTLPQVCNPVGFESRTTQSGVCFGVRTGLDSRSQSGAHPLVCANGWFRFLVGEVC